MVSQAQEMKTYTDNTTKTSINYPINWEYQANPATVFILIRPLEKQGQTFRENVNLIINDGQGLVLQEYVGAAKVQLRKSLSNYKALSTDYLEFGGRKYARIIYTHSAQNLSLQVAYYLTLDNNQSYNLTYSSIQQNFKEYLPVFEKMMSSFKLKN